MADATNATQMAKVMKALVRLNVCLTKAGCEAVLVLPNTDDLSPQDLLRQNPEFQALINFSIAEEGKEPDCPICYEAFHHSNILLKHEDCRQTYHSECLLDWVWAVENDSCPQCRRHIVGALPQQASITSQTEEVLREQVEAHDDPHALLKEIETKCYNIVTELDTDQLEKLRREIRKVPFVMIRYLPFFTSYLPSIEEVILDGQKERLALTEARLSALGDWLGDVDPTTVVADIQPILDEWFSLLEDFHFRGGLLSLASIGYHPYRGTEDHIHNFNELCAPRIASYPGIADYIVYSQRQVLKNLDEMEGWNDDDSNWNDFHPDDEDDEDDISDNEDEDYDDQYIQDGWSVGSSPRWSRPSSPEIPSDALEASDIQEALETLFHATTIEGEDD